MSSKKLLIAAISCFFLLFPRLKLNSCGDGRYYDNRFWIFQPNLVNNDALLPFTYASSFYFDLSNIYNDGHYFPLDSTYLKTNVKEWQAECPTANAADIHTLLYNMKPDVYIKKLATDGFGQNTFAKALKANRELLQYFNFAKKCEYAFNSDESTADWDLTVDSLAKKGLVGKAETLFKTTKSPFVRLRTAYQLMKAYEYLKNTEGVKKTFDTYIKGTKSTSWIVGSALFYYAKAHSNPIERNLCAADCYEKTEDKKFQALDLIKTEKPQETLAAARDDHQRALVGTMILLNHPGRSLGEMQVIYKSEPTQTELPMLIEREINKLENWLFAYKMSGSVNTGNSPTAVESYDSDKPDDYNEKRRAEQQKANWASDRQYLNDVVAFVNKLISENKVKDRAFMLLSGAHLAFLQQDFKQARTHLATLKTEKNVPANIRVQAELTNVLCDLYAAPTISPAVEDAIVRFETTLQANKKAITGFKVFREQIYLFLGKKFIEQGLIGKGCMLTMMTERYTKGLIGPADENGYHRLYALGKPADFDYALKVMTAPKTAFEKFLAKENRPYSLDTVWIETKNWSGKKPYSWDVNKIKDYKGSYYLRHDKIDSALAVFKTIPDSIWEEEPYRSYLGYCNPFYVDVVHPHQRIDVDTVTYNKTSFLGRVVKLQKEAQANPSLNAKNYYLLGNAYFNMTWHGNYWLISDICWGTYEGYSDYFKEDNTFVNNYFGLERAQKQYELCLKNTKDEKLAALCHFMIGFCTKTRTNYWYYQNNNRWSDKVPKPAVAENAGNAVFKSKFPNRLSAYTSKKYWCTNYESLAKLYCGF
jgi:hypothetical protein